MILASINLTAITDVPLGATAWQLLNCWPAAVICQHRSWSVNLALVIVLMFPSWCSLLQAQLANRSAAAFSGVQAAGATAAERAAQVEALNAALQVKEAQLAEAVKEIADLKVY
jgi:hypothetical protein